MSKKKTAREKLTDAHFKVVDDPKTGGTLLIPKASEFEELVRTIRKGKLATLGSLRDELAKRYKADGTCPLVSGIYMRLIAEAAEEDREAGKEAITPYWRVIKDDGSLNDKFPGGAESHAEKLLAEGFEILPTKSKKPPKVKDYEKKLR